MLLLSGCIAWLAIMTVLIARAVRQYGAYEQLTAASALDVYPHVIIILPARNERENICPCLQRLVDQDYPTDRLSIIVVDDNSTDDTRQLATDFAAHDPRVRIVPGASLPHGWKGKPFACWQGARAIDADQPSDDAFLCFIDCDTRAAPGLLRAAVARAQSTSLDLLSLEPFQILGSFWERVLIPAGFFLLAFSQDLRRVNDPALPDAFANGQFILIRRRTYDTLGGHASVRAAIAEDTALARLVKHSGHRIAVLGAERLLTTRMYHSLAELWQGLAKNLPEMLGGRGRVLISAAFGILLALASIALPALAWRHVAHAAGAIALTAAICSTLATAALLGVHIGSARYLRIPLAYGLLFPIGYLVGAALAIDSLRTRSAGQIAWKGRVYARADAEG